MAHTSDPQGKDLMNQSVPKRTPVTCGRLETFLQARPDLYTLYDVSLKLAAYLFAVKKNFNGRPDDFINQLRESTVWFLHQLACLQDICQSPIPVFLNSKFT